MRPLPELTPASEWFWKSGADGRLRIQGCADSGALVHPPVPICPNCRSRSWQPTPVSGRGTVVGFTVNTQPWQPGFDLDPPYVIANVALAEDASVRLTTNIVGCAPDGVHIGQEVAVRFEQHDDVWLPLFEPTSALAVVAAACLVSWSGEPLPGDVGGQLDRHERQPVPQSLWRLAGDARLHRAERSGQRRPEPGGHLPGPMTMDDYLSARPITSPFGLYDCDVPCDGSVA
ncbi:MAG TPA: OB-fold domain-containing protein, partial [Acidimicrobiales bacterium]